MDILDQFAVQGIVVTLDKFGKPVARGTGITAEKMALLTEHRAAIVAALKAREPSRYPWTNDDRAVELLGVGGIQSILIDRSTYPPGCRWWRYLGEIEWKPIPGTPAEVKP